MRIRPILPLFAVTLSAAAFACGSGATPGAADVTGATEPTGTGDSPDAGVAALDSAAPSPGASAIRTELTTVVPAGVQCIVATIGGTPPTNVSTAVMVGQMAATINLGILEPGPITVSANAYNSPCPGTGNPSWTSEPVTATVLPGVATTIPIVFEPTSTGTVSVAFSQPAVSIAVTPTNTYVVLQDGTVRGWGSNQTGQFGSGAAGASSYAPVVVPGVSGAVQVTAGTGIDLGTGFACVVRADHSVLCWGAANQPSLGNFPTVSNTTTLISTPILQVGVSALIAQASTWHGMTFLRPDGAVGTTDGYLAWSAAPTTIPIDLAAGPYISTTGACSVSQEGVASGSLPSVALPSVSVSPAAHVFVGGEGSSAITGCAILASGQVSCWGTTNTDGELGLGVASTSAVSPTIVPGLSNITTMTLSRGLALPAHACAAVQGGAVLCSGNNADGQLGNGTATSTNSFTPVSGLTNVTHLAAGQNHTCAIRADGAVYCWGNNDYGQLGDGTTTTRFTPVAVGGW